MKREGVIAAAAVYVVLCGQALGAVTATLSQRSGPPSTAVTATGAGFDASTLIDVFFDTTEVQLATTNASGTVSTAVTIPTDAQPGLHWVTLSERRTDAAAQVSYNVFVNWAQTGYGPSKRSYNPYENTINSSNVARLTRLWSQPLDGFGNSKPLIVYGNIIFVQDVNQVVRAFSLAGKLLWTAALPETQISWAPPPAAGDSKVFFANYDGNVRAYNFQCHSNGATCSPAWTINIGASVIGGLTFRNNLIYVPASDGYVHVLNPATGAQNTSYAISVGNALTSWIAFAADGTGYVASGSSMGEVSISDGYTFTDAYPATLSYPAVGNDTAYVTETDNYLREVQYSWTTPTSGSGCGVTTPPAFANGVVYAAGCASLGAYDAGSGSALWTITTPGSSAGLSYANGVLYACVNERLVAYSASYGGRLWSGGYCSAAPVIANGVLYSTFSGLSAYTLNGAQTTVRIKRPDPRVLKAQSRRGFWTTSLRNPSGTAR